MSVSLAKALAKPKTPWLDSHAPAVVGGYGKCERCKISAVVYPGYAFTVMIPFKGMVEKIGDLCGICRIETGKRRAKDYSNYQRA